MFTVLCGVWPSRSATHFCCLCSCKYIITMYSLCSGQPLECCRLCSCLTQYYLCTAAGEHSTTRVCSWKCMLLTLVCAWRKHSQTIHHVNKHASACTAIIFIMLELQVQVMWAQAANPRYATATVYLQQRKHVMITIFVFAVQKTLITILDL